MYQQECRILSSLINSAVGLGRFEDLKTTHHESVAYEFYCKSWRVSKAKANLNLPSDKVGISLVVQMVKNPPAMQGTWVQSLGQEGPLEKGLATHYSILALENFKDRGAWRATVHGITKSRT